MTGKPKRPRGRPSVYTEEIASHICAELAKGGTLNGVCREPGMPDPATVLNWVMDDREGFSQRYARARETGYRIMADDIIEIADEEGDNARNRLRVDTRKWLLAKALPKIYGDKLAIGGASDLPPIMTDDVSRLTPDEITARIALLDRRAAET